MFFWRIPRLFAKDGDGSEGGGGGGGDAGGGGGGDEAAARVTAAREAARAAGTFLVSDWREAVPKEYAGHASLADIKDLGAMVKSYVNAQKLIGGERIPLPKPDAPDEEWAGVFAKLGRPETPDKYELARAEGAPEGFAYNEALEADFRTEAHKLGLSAKQAKGVWNMLQAKAHASFNDVVTANTTRLSKAVEGLKAEWGQAFPQKLKLAQRAVDALEVQGGVKGLNRWLKESGAGQEPILQRVFALIGEQAGEERLGPGERRDTLTPAEAESKVNSIMQEKTNPKYEAYWKKRHPDHKKVVEEVQGLLRHTGD
jgi:hypothetical protein